MAQKVTGIIKLQINAAKATASPPVGPALGQHGVNIAAFIKEFNARTQAMEGYKIPVVITVYADRSFTFITKTPPTPLTEEEVYEMGVEKREIVVNYAVGDTVRILDGPLSSFTGTVDSIEVDQNTVSVIVSMFGRETPVEFELDQVEVVSQ